MSNPIIFHRDFVISIGLLSIFILSEISQNDIPRRRRICRCCVFEFICLFGPIHIWCLSMLTGICAPMSLRALTISSTSCYVSPAAKQFPSISSIQCIWHSDKGNTEYVWYEAHTRARTHKPRIILRIDCVLYAAKEKNPKNENKIKIIQQIQHVRYFIYCTCDTVHTHTDPHTCRLHTQTYKKIKYIGIAEYTESNMPFACQILLKTNLTFTLNDKMWNLLASSLSFHFFCSLCLCHLFFYSYSHLKWIQVNKISSCSKRLRQHQWQRQYHTWHTHTYTAKERLSHIRIRKEKCRTKS